MIVTTLAARESVYRRYPIEQKTHYYLVNGEWWASTPLKRLGGCCAGFANEYWPALKRCLNDVHKNMLKSLIESYAEVKKLKAENFALAAGMCCEPEEGLTADEGGTPYCALASRKLKLQAAAEALLSLWDEPGVYFDTPDDYNRLFKAMESLREALK